MIREFLDWLSGAQNRLIREASETGTLTLEQMFLPGGLGWHCQLRRREHPRYSWTSSDYTINGAVRAVIAEAKAWPVGGKELMPCAPKLGGAEFDAD